MAPGGSQGIHSMSVRTIEPNDLRVLLCFAFDHRAKPSEIAAFKSSLIKSETVLHSVEVSGTFDFICEERLPSLRAYHRRYSELAPDVARLAERFEACFVCKRFVRSERSHVEAFWVSCHDGKRRIAVEQIDAIHADGDYVRLRCGSESLLHDSTMKAMIAALDGDDFVRLHRSIIVRLDKSTGSSTTTTAGLFAWKTGPRSGSRNRESYRSCARYEQTRRLKKALRRSMTKLDDESNTLNENSLMQINNTEKEPLLARKNSASRKVVENV